MGLLDKFKKTAEDAKDAVVKNADSIDKGIDKVADVIDGKTGGKHSDQIDKAADKVHGLVDKLEGDKGE